MTPSFDRVDTRQRPLPTSLPSAATADTTIDALALLVRLCALAFALGIAYSMSSDPGFDAAFAWHPTLMSTGFVLFMTEGVLAYVNTFPSPREREIRRDRHGAIQIAAGLLLLGGYAAVFIAHEQNGQSHFASSSSTSRAVHVWFGYAILALVAIQITVGVLKYLRLKSVRVKMFRWHGKLGRWIYAAGLANIAIAVGFWSEFTTEIRVVMYAALLIVPGCTLLLLGRAPLPAESVGTFRPIPVIDSSGSSSSR
eukprot:g2577.t1